MRVAMYYNNDDVRTEEMPIPKIGPGEMLVRVEASGICGSDVMFWYRKDKVPLVLGHEIAGVVVEVGKDVKRYRVGDRVSASHHVPCNTCHYCRNGNETVCDTLRRTNFDPGGFAEFVRLPEINVDRGVYPIPDEVSFEEATFTEPLACVLRGLRRAHMKPGDSVLVLGSGIAGILYIALAKALGAGRIIATDISPYRVNAAKRFGAEQAFSAADYTPEKLCEVNDGRLADLVVICTGAVTAIKQAFASVRRGGTIMVFAPTDAGVEIPISINDLFWKTDLTITTSYAGTPADHMTAMELIRAGRVPVADMITHRFGLADAAKGFKLVAEAKDSIKVIIEPQR